MPREKGTSDIHDLFVIGGGINGCGIARDAAGRGLDVVLAEMNDLASATSSASTKLFHGGLRYLEYFEFRLVRESLLEREVLLRAMPHISWPMRFVLPYHRKMRFESNTPMSRVLNVIMPWMNGRRPAWLIRLGLFLYDSLGKREILPGSTSLDLTVTPEGKPLQNRFQRAFEYSDCWIEDSRLVVLNARDAEARGASILVRTTVTRAEREGDVWVITTQDTSTGRQQSHRARVLINAGGPWVADIIQRKLRLNSTEGVRLVRGSHIVTRKLCDHDKCYFFQGTDGRIVFAIPYETDFTLIGTTDTEHEDISIAPQCTEDECDYLLQFTNNYFKEPITKDDIVWTYAGVRPLYDDGAPSATATTRDYTLKVDRTGGAPILHCFGGKITTYRRLAESALHLIADHFDNLPGPWTAGVPLPGGDFPVDGFDKLVTELNTAHPYLTERHANRLVRAYGTEAMELLGDAKSYDDLGQDFGATLSEREVGWLMEREYAVTAEDIVWRRSKLGLKMTPDHIRRLDDWMAEKISGSSLARNAVPGTATGGG